MHIKHQIIIITIITVTQSFFHHFANLGTQLTPLQQTIQGQKIFRQGLRLLRNKAETTYTAKTRNGTSILPSVTSDIILPAVKAVINAEPPIPITTLPPIPVTTPTPAPTPTPTPTVVTSTTTLHSATTTEENILFLGNQTEFEKEFPLLDWVSYAQWHRDTGTVSRNTTMSSNVKAIIPLQYKSLGRYIFHKLLNNQTIFKTGPIRNSQSIFHFITGPRRNYTHRISKRFVPTSIVSGAMKLGAQAVKSGFIKDFVFQMAKPILSRVVANDQSKLLGNWVSNLLPNTHISNSHVQTNIRELIKKEDSQGVVRALEKSRLAYNVKDLYEEKGAQGVDVINAAIREQLPFYDEVLRERISSASLVTNTLITSWFQTLKSTLSKDINGAALKMDLFQVAIDKLTELATRALDKVSDYITYTLLSLVNLLIIGLGIKSHIANRQTQKGIGYLGIKLSQMETRQEQYIQDRIAENKSRITEIRNPRNIGTRVSIRGNNQVTPL